MEKMTFRVLTMTAALGLAAATSVSAQTNGWLGTGTSYSQDDYRAPYANARRAAYDNGYRDGLKRGEDAARNGRPFNVERERDYRGADNGYNRAYGDRARYRDDYRGGFAQGYRDGYSRRGNTSRGYGDNSGAYGGYGGGYGNGQYGNRGDGDNRGYGNRGYGDRGYGNVGYGAFQNGASDGYRKGLEDIQKRRYPDVTRHSWYRNGDHDYDRAYGSKDAYKVEYRRGFQEGYNRAFREGRRY
ncbi:MAG TPA: hypothetical protein VEL51_05990 [Vicinamibacterales bacterium]|nr:hypothetical protein [Vicinamibacterales bacterium]